jgi:hypothetical protein
LGRWEAIRHAFKIVFSKFLIFRLFWCINIKNNFLNKKYYYNIFLNEKHLKKSNHWRILERWEAIQHVFKIVFLKFLIFRLFWCINIKNNFLNKKYYYNIFLKKNNLKTSSNFLTEYPVTKPDKGNKVGKIPYCY